MPPALAAAGQLQGSPVISPACQQLFPLLQFPKLPALGRGPALTVGSSLAFPKGPFGPMTLHVVGLGFHHFDIGMTQVNLKQVNRCPCADQLMYNSTENCCAHYSEVWCASLTWGKCQFFLSFLLTLKSV